MKNPPIPKRRIDIDHILIEKGKRGYYSPKQGGHSHNFYELFYITHGKCRFLLKDNLYELTPGDLVFIAPGELHHNIFQDQETCEMIMIYFKKEYVDIEFSNIHSFMGSVPSIYRDEFEFSLNRMLSENSMQDEYAEGFRQCHLKAILLLLMRHSVLNEKDPDILNSKDADILLATKYIYKNFKQPLTLEEVSAVASLSPTYFSKKFKQIVGMGFKEYLNFVRLKHAQAALLTTNHTITDIALEYGFNDSNYFKDLFKKVYGRSPREFRKNPD